VRLERCLDPEGERHDCGRATLTGADHADLHDPIGIDTDELDVASVGMEAGADVLVEDGLDALSEAG
jgi:hypothetical protein